MPTIPSATCLHQNSRDFFALAYIIVEFNRSITKEKLLYEINNIYYTYISQRRKKMGTAKLFQNGSSQAVRLPKEFRLLGEVVKIFHRGNQVVLEPLELTWDSLFKSLDEFPEDFMEDGRNQPDMQKRDTF
jgi:antitoxin VapB